MLITIDDCIGLSGLSEEEVEAIAEHEHLPEIVAAELGNYLVGTASGQEEIRRMIADDIAEARAHGRHDRAALLSVVLSRFLNGHTATGATTP